MPAKKKNIEIKEIELLGIQRKKSNAARQTEIRKTGEYIKVHKQASSGKTTKAS